jgi:tripartite-type tricarboxylate transporter receptor subunit TctC
MKHDRTRNSDSSRDGMAVAFHLYLVRAFRAQGHANRHCTQLNAAAVEALADAAVRSRFIELGYEFFPRDQQTPEAFAALLRADAEKWWPIIKELKIGAE